MPRHRFTLAASAVGVAAMMFASGPAAPPAFAEPAEPAIDYMYPLTEVLDILTGPAFDLSRPGMLDYFVKAGILTNAKHLTEPFQKILDPRTYDGPDGARQAQVAAQTLIDAVLHLPPFSAGFPPNPDYLPDWNANGVFGMADTPGLPGADADMMLDDDYSPDAPTSAKFRYPCIDIGGTVDFEVRDGSCVAGDTPGADFKLGTVYKTKVVDSRGMKMIAKVWLPEGAETSGQKYPVTLASPGAAERQLDLAMYIESGVRNGFIGVSYDQAGNTGSEGDIADPFTPLLGVPYCVSPGSCLDVQDMTRWIVQDDITPIMDLNNELANIIKLPLGDVTVPGVSVPRLVRRNSYYEPVGENVRNPWIDLMDADHINLWGQSLGSVGATAYLHWQKIGHGADGRPLPRVSSVVGLSGFTGPGDADVPYQMQTADFDIPGLFAHGLLPFANPVFDTTDGPVGTKQLYDEMLGKRLTDQPLMWMSYEGGSHGDNINWPGVPRGVWSAAISTSYAVNWFNCYGRADKNQSSCDALLKPMPHLSRAVATEYAPQGPNGPSLCVTIPDRATIGQLIQEPLKFWDNLNGRPQYNCTPQS
ncbi:hypothetical protein AB0N05_34200 [Nocardia sp. NPDC051030]|uniref:hypothetical protein n=1 Tax=Nocardia sp. NPDC051030 TaxID=3155162 RepID=UPI00342958A7